MKRYPLLVVSLALACLAAPLHALLIVPEESTINPFDCYIYWRPEYRADTWVGIECWDPVIYPDGYESYWFVGGYLSALDMEDAILIRTAPTDTNGGYGPEHADWFFIPVNTSRPRSRPLSLTIPSLWYRDGWAVESLPNDPWGVRLAPRYISAEIPATVPDGASTAGLLAAAIAGLAAVRRQSTRSVRRCARTPR